MNKNGKECGFKFIILVLTCLRDDKTRFNATNKLMILKGEFWYETWILVYSR